LHFLNLASIEQSLRQVQANFEAINAQLELQREGMTESLVNNLVSAYRYLDTLVERGDDLFVSQELKHLLELNHRVLCGVDVEMRQEFRTHIQATHDKFYKHISWVKTWYKQHRKDPVYKRAAGVYVAILCQPQLFIEGNHRTGALIASLELLRAGNPPFVLTIDNAVGYFNPSAVIKFSDRRKVWHSMFKMPGIKKQFGKFLETHANTDYLLPQTLHAEVATE
jgi:prophage maintenance system killer protein